MDATQIRQLKPMLTRYLKRFDNCFSRKDTRAHMSVYVEGQLSLLIEEASVLERGPEHNNTTKLSSWTVRQTGAISF
jgi:hypothetical protein